jgi:uncharacterized protein (TIGR00369 family)
MANANRLSRVVGKLAGLPPGLRSLLVTLAFTRQVRFAGTARIRFLELAEGRALLALRNRRKVQNHIGGVHAAAMALLAETATGAVLGMTIPDTHLPLLKSMHIDYVRRATGGLRAEATLPEDLRRRVLTEEKGDFAVPVKVTDDNGEVPIQAQMVWAWVPKKKPG